MSKPKRQETEDRRQETGGGKRRAFYCLLLTAYCLLLAGACRMDMQDQPKLEVYEKATSTRQYPQGTVARGFLKEDRALYTGKKDTAGQGGAAAATGGQNQGGGNTTGSSNNAGTQANASYPDDVDTFPFPVTAEVVKRGQERYNIFCAACHGPVGYGDGMIVRRGFRRPQSFHTDQLRGAPVGHFFDVVTNGWGAMPSYAPQVPVRDRWAIIAYIRALQLSQNQQPGTNTNAPAPTNPPAMERPESQDGGQR